MDLNIRICGKNSVPLSVFISVLINNIFSNKELDCSKRHLYHSTLMLITFLKIKNFENFINVIDSDFTRQGYKYI